MGVRASKACHNTRNDRIKLYWTTGQIYGPDFNLSPVRVSSARTSRKKELINYLAHLALYDTRRPEYVGEVPGEQGRL